MGRNLRLDWRALALLGALLSIIVKWPALVYAMPTIFLPANIQSNEMTTMLTRINDTSPAAMILREITNPTTINYNSSMLKIQTNNKNESKTKEDSQRNSNKTEEEKSENENENKNKSENNENKNEEEIKRKQLNDPIKSSEYITRSSERRSDGDTANQSTQQYPHMDTSLVTVTSKNEQLHNTQHLKLLNLISNRRKRKKLFNKNAEDVQSPSTDNNSVISHSDSSNNILNSNSNQNNNIIDKFIEKRTLSTNNTNITEEISQKPSSDISSEASTTSTTTTTALTTTPPSTIIVSTIEPTTVALTTNVNSNSNIITAHYGDNNNLASFKFSSSHHIAILSRTERSIHATATNHHNINDEISDETISSSSKKRRSSDVVSKAKRLNNSRNTHGSNSNNKQLYNLDRNERSTVSHAMSPLRKIRLYIKNRYMQILPDGTINGTYNESSDYTILERSTVDVGRIKIQSVATCLYLCMDSCGSIYGSKDFTDDCVFNENMEQHNYNTYSSTYNSNSRRVYYLALNRHGEPRRLQIPPSRSLGKLATYTNAITDMVEQERVEQLIAKTFGANRIKHGIRQLCDTGKPLIELIDTRNFKAQPVCNPNISSSSSGSTSSSSSNSNSNSSANNSNHNSRNNSNRNINSNNSNSSGHLLHNVPVANDKHSLEDINSHSPNVNSVSNSSSMEPINSDNLKNSNSFSKSHNNTSSSSSSSSSSVTQQHNGPKKKKKRRKCRPNENEEENDCHRGPQALRKKGNGNLKKCRELQQQLNKQLANGDVVDASLSNATLSCPPKRTGKKHGGPNAKKHNANALANGNGGNNRRGKKNNLNRSNSNAGKKNGGKKGKKNNGKRQKKHPPKTSTTSTTPSSTLRPFYLTTTTLRALFSTTPIATEDHIDNERVVHPNDRGDREQRNVHTSSEENVELYEHEDHDDSEEEHENDRDHEDDGDDDMDINDDSYEESDNKQSKLPSDQTGVSADTSHPQLTGGSDYIDDYYQTDYLPIGLWELFALLWITFWCARIRI